MNDDSRPANRWRQVRQHPAFQAAAVYVGGGWALIQVADIFVPNPAIVRWLGIVLALGFLAVVGTGWVSAARVARRGVDYGSAVAGTASAWAGKRSTESIHSRHGA